MDFAKNLHKGFGAVEDLVPRIRVKYRDELNFSGKKIPYKDFTKFVRRGEKIIPFFSTSVEEGDTVFDATPLLCVGAAEVLATMIGCDDVASVDFYNELIHLNVCDSLEHFSDIREELVHFNLNNIDEELAVLFSLRSGYTDFKKPIVRRIISQLYLAHLNSDKLFCEALINSMAHSYSICSLYTTPLDNLKGEGYSNQEETMILSITNCLNNLSLHCKKIGYTIPDGTKKHYITDGRGAGIYCYILLLYAMYGAFGEKLSSRSVDIGQTNLEKIEKTQKLFWNCLGDDVSGTYYRIGRFIPRYSKEDTGGYYDASQLMPFQTSVLYNIGETEKITREMYENRILMKRACGVSFIKDSVGRVYSRNYEDCYCVTIPVLQESSSLMFNFDTFATIRKTAVKAMVEQAAGEALTEIGNENESLKARNKELERQVFELQKQVNLGLDVRLKELENQLASKGNIIDQLTSELKSANAEIESYYNEYEADEEVEEVSLEEMVRFLNDYQLCMVGGRDDLCAKLEDYGLTNISQVNGERVLNSTPFQADFFCINTQFISHKLVNNVRERYSGQTGQMFYYNGTNVDSLIRVCYEFIKNWLEG